jgi:hypothetical protein
MKAYSFMLKSLKPVLMDRFGMSQEELLVAVAATGLHEMMFTYEDLERYGLSGDEIYCLVGKGFLQETEVSGRQARSISMQHRYRTDPAFRKRVDDMRTSSHGPGAGPSKGSMYLKAARRARGIYFRQRRTRVKTHVLLPVFGDGGLPSNVSTAKALYECMRHEKTRHFYADLRDPYSAMRRDLRKLGVGGVGRSGEGVSFVKKMVFETMPQEERDSLRRESRARLEKAHRALQDPEARNEPYKRAARTRTDRMAKDPEYRERMTRGLPCGTIARTTRMELRHSLLKDSIVPAMGPDGGMTWRRLYGFISSNGFRERYAELCEGKNVERTVRSDLAWLNRESATDVAAGSGNRGQ